MPRKQIYISMRHHVQLKRIAQTPGISEVAIIRQAIDRELRLFAARSAKGNRSALEEFIRFGLLRQSSKDATSDATCRGWARHELYDER